MRSKTSGFKPVVVLGVWLLILLPGITMLHSLEGDPGRTTQEDTTKKKKNTVDSTGKETGQGRLQTPAQTTAIRKAQEAREKALAEAKAKTLAEAKAAANTDTNTTSSEDSTIPTDTSNSIPTAIIAPVTTTPEVVDPIKTKIYWKGLKIELDKKIEELKTTLIFTQEKLGQTRMKFLSEPSPLRQREMQEEINKLIEEIGIYENALANTEQQLKDLSDKARKAGVPPGWVR